jgi:hypothetical protein
LSITASATASPQNQPLSLGGASSSDPHSAGATEHLFSTQDRCRLNQLHFYLIGQPTSKSTSPPALHALLEAQQAAIIKHFQQIQAEFELKLTQTLQDTIKDAVTAALHSQTPPPIHRTYYKVPDTPRASLDTGKGKYREYSVPTKSGSTDRSESSEKHIKIESPTSGTHLSSTGTGLSLWSLYQVTRSLLTRSNTCPLASYNLLTTPQTSRNRGRGTEENGAVCRASWSRFCCSPSRGH